MGWGIRMRAAWFENGRWGTYALDLGADHFRLHSCDFGVRFPVLGQCGSSVPHRFPDWERCKYSSMEKINTDPKKVNKSGPILGRYFCWAHAHACELRVWATRLRLRCVCVYVSIPRSIPKLIANPFFLVLPCLSSLLSVCLFVLLFALFALFTFTILYSCYNVQFRPVSSAEFLVLIRVQILCIIVRRCKGRKFA